MLPDNLLFRATTSRYYTGSLLIVNSDFQLFDSIIQLFEFYIRYSIVSFAFYYVYQYHI